MSDIDYSGDHQFVAVEWDEDGPVEYRCEVCDVREGSRSARENPCPPR